MVAFGIFRFFSTVAKMSWLELRTVVFLNVRDGQLTDTDVNLNIPESNLASGRSELATGPTLKVNKLKKNKKTSSCEED